jgi:PadR family transcriptional regulator, regulatory protein PadR
MGRKSTREADRLELVRGTLDMLILKTLRPGRMHGQGIVRTIEQSSEDLFRVDHGSLYPALQRLQQEGWITAEWGVSTNNRKAKFYSLTRAGREHLQKESSRWEKFSRAIGLIMHPAGQE